METKALAYGIIGFLLGGFVVSVAATQQGAVSNDPGDEMTMSQMTEDLRDKSGDAYDEAFIASMIHHHEGALDMALLSKERAKHPEIKELSEAVIAEQSKEIEQMRAWQKAWGYETDEPHSSH